MNGSWRTSNTFSVKAKLATSGLPKGRDQDEGALRPLEFFHYSLEEWNRRKSVCEGEVLLLGECVYGFWVVGRVPTEEAWSLFGGVAGEEVYCGGTPTCQDRPEH
jgi:hypothetical protein